jgi:hypothetical protein
MNDLVSLSAPSGAPVPRYTSPSVPRVASRSPGFETLQKPDRSPERLVHRRFPPRAERMAEGATHRQIARVNTGNAAASPVDSTA